MIQSLQISDYDIGEILGVGTVGTIYAATRRDDGSAVAIKRLHPGVSNDPTIRARFEREMLILQRLRHPNIIRYDGGGVIGGEAVPGESLLNPVAGGGQARPGLAIRTGELTAAVGQLFYVMELVDGGTVKELIAARGRIAWPVVTELTRQICSALQCAHNHGVIHRDLKPGNLFLTRTGVLKLGDFGIARDQQNTDLTSSGMTVGTHAYMAPEQITGDARISGKADLYALGCCIYEMLAGQKVFAGDNFAQLFEQHLRSEPPPVERLVPDCPPALSRIISQLLAKEPEDRPFNARMVQGVMNELESQRMSAGQTVDRTAGQNAGRTDGQNVDRTATERPETGASLPDGVHRPAGPTTTPTPGRSERGVPRGGADQGDVADIDDPSADVGADAIDAQTMLRQQIADRLSAETPRVSWSRLIVILVILTAIVGVIWCFSG